MEGAGDGRQLVLGTRRRKDRRLLGGHVEVLPLGEDVKRKSETEGSGRRRCLGLGHSRSRGSEAVGTTIVVLNPPNAATH